MKFDLLNKIIFLLLKNTCNLDVLFEYLSWKKTYSTYIWLRQNVNKPHSINTHPFLLTNSIFTVNVHKEFDSKHSINALISINCLRTLKYVYFYVTEEICVHHCRCHWQISNFIWKITNLARNSIQSITMSVLKISANMYKTHYSLLKYLNMYLLWFFLKLFFRENLKFSIIFCT